VQYNVVDYHFDEQQNHLLVYVYFSKPVPRDVVSRIMKSEMDNLVQTRNPDYDVQMFSWLQTPTTAPGEAERLWMADGNSYYFYDFKKRLFTAGGKL
jgi:hypothetical protein